MKIPAFSGLPHKRQIIKQPNVRLNIQQDIQFTGLWRDIRQQLMKEKAENRASFDDAWYAADIKRVTDFSKKDFGAGVTGLKVLMALYTIYSKPRNRFIKKFRPEVTYKVKGNIEQYFLPEQASALEKSIGELAGIKIERRKFPWDDRYEEFGREIINIPLVQYRKVACTRYYLDFENATITPQQQVIISDVLQGMQEVKEIKETKKQESKQKEVQNKTRPNNTNELNLNFQDNYYGDSNAKI